tara:strand:+ start:12782 stop:14083 length:1302 start_codon:yes stop_codon:yes gene_type:complete
MKYIPCTIEEEKNMLKTIGVDSFDDLINIIPDKMRLLEEYNISSPMSELELIDHITNLANKNSSNVSFLGGGVYDRYVPSIVDFIASRSEFYTAYTPYQPEVSQGTLQYLYEYQSMICSLSGMDACNASLYDGGSALAEACILAKAFNSKSKILISPYVNPNYIEVLKSYLKELDYDIEILPAKNGITDLNEIENFIDDSVSSIVVQSPNYIGQIEDWSKIKKDNNIMLIGISDPVSLGILESPGNSGVDIYIGEGQSLGNYQAFGGPYLGIMAVKKYLIRKMPGRVVGRTNDIKGKDAYVLTLQTREQHIRREKATSNICTNQGLIALRATIYLSLMGPKGLDEINKLSMNKAYYMADLIDCLDNYSLVYNTNFINEFLIETKYDAYKVKDKCLENNIFINPINNHQILFAVTERRTKKEIKKLVEILGKID